MKTIELCSKCAAIMADGYKIKQLPRPANHKVFCEMCQRKRYGASYQVEKKERMG